MLEKRRLIFFWCSLLCLVLDIVEMKLKIFELFVCDYSSLSHSLHVLNKRRPQSRKQGIMRKLEKSQDRKAIWKLSRKKEDLKNGKDEKEDFQQSKIKKEDWKQAR